MANIKLGQRYTTQKSGVKGRVVRMVLNETGTTRLLLLTKGNKGIPQFRWTTYVPPRLGQVKRSK